MISNEKIEGFGFSDLRTEPLRQYSLTEFASDPLRFLCNLDLLHFNFVIFDDEIIRCRFQGESWKIFGDQGEDMFGIEEASGRVFFITRSLEGDTDLQICAETMDDFASLFNMFISYTFRFRASLKRPEDDQAEDARTYFLSYAGKYLNAETLATSYWATMCELVEHGELMLTNDFVQLFSTDRVLRGDDSWLEESTDNS
ncbi:hypothetical protein GAO09_22110 [Rhizobiales bacterium RZME27]|uniref:Uncharacterized protein n=1 Tax=Endobacterium cereale TaxID=2663029 RepID=A0A6A8AIV9_9HYPH|nr:hypothetical protein [Endobacterium cereale]MEB2845642.1 hypothetical protein [Endobacterium cereale]MQY48731.1 hypothetical protein [Endobacterium cereale]